MTWRIEIQHIIDLAMQSDRWDGFIAIGLEYIFAVSSWDVQGEKNRHRRSFCSHGNKDRKEKFASFQRDFLFSSKPP